MTTLLLDAGWILSGVLAWSLVIFHPVPDLDITLLDILMLPVCILFGPAILGVILIFYFAKSVNNIVVWKRK